MVVLNSFGQLAVSDPQREFRQALEWTEQKAKWAEEKAHSMQMITNLTEQLKKADSLKRRIDQTYDLAEKTYLEAKRYESLLNSGVPDMIYGLETVMEVPLNPADYIPRLGGHTTKLRSLVEYESAEHVSQDARIVINDIFKETPLKYRVIDGDTVSYKPLRFTKPAKQMMDLWSGLENASDAAKRDAIAQQLALAAQYEEMHKRMLKETLEETNLELSNYERIQMLLVANQVNLEAQRIRQQALDDLAKLSKESIMDQETVDRCANKAIAYHFNKVFINSGKKYQDRKNGISMRRYEQSYRKK